MTKLSGTQGTKRERQVPMTLRELTGSELRRVTGGQEMEHGGRIRW